MVASDDLRPADRYNAYDISRRHSSDWRNVSSVIKVAELFAGVGGFRLGLEGYDNPSLPDMTLPSAGPYTTVWANQWEPPGTVAKQFAARCYETRFGAGSVVNEDINAVMNAAEAGDLSIPDIDMVVGGFPCQDYSVAKPLSMAGGIEGKKGVLWWDIHRILKLKKPRYVLLENVDRLLKSPASQRGRDFAIILSCLAKLGYSAEWRVVNSAEYGFSQRRKRVYLFAELASATWETETRITDGVFSDALPIQEPASYAKFAIPNDPYEASQHFGKGLAKSPFLTAGVMQGYNVITADIVESYDGPRSALKDVLVPQEEVPASFYLAENKVEDWRYLKGSKREERTDKKTGYTYFYSEGSMSFPDPIDKPSRTILTGEGGSGASRFKHVIECPDGRLRRLVPDELDQLQGFPKGWTNTGMSDGNRAFCMGNALVVGVVHRIGKAIADRHTQGATA